MESRNWFQRLLSMYMHRFNDWRFYTGAGIWLILLVVEMFTPDHNLKGVLSPIAKLVLLATETLGITLLVFWVFDNLTLPGVEFDQSWAGTDLPHELSSSPQAPVLLAATRIGIALIYVAIAVVVAAFVRGFMLPF